MKNKLARSRVLFFIFICIFSISTALFAASSITLDTTLTDKVSDKNIGESKDVFSADTPIIYLTWQSDQLKDGQKIRAVWIADDTNNVAPPHYKIDEATFDLNKDFKDKMLSALPGAFWDGKFSLSKPTSGWPVGKYHVDVYVDSDLVKTIPFSIGQGAATAEKTASATKETWGAISIDTAGDKSSPYYGNGGGATQDEAEKNADKFCVEAGGQQCKMMLSYEQCGAYAASPQSAGKGIGETKKIAEGKALSDCNDKACQIVISDCNDVKE